MVWISDMFAALAISQLVTLGLYFLSHHRGILARLISLFCLCLTAYVMATTSVVVANTLPSWILFRLATLAPIILWFISFLLFVDSGRVPIAAWVAIIYFIIVRGLGSAIGISNPEFLASGSAFVFVQLLPQFILLYFSIHAVYLAYQGYSADLVEERRRLRMIFVVFMGLLIATIVGMGIVDYFEVLPSIPTGVYSLLIFLAGLGFSLVAFRLNDEALGLVPEKEATPSAVPADNRQAAELDPKTVLAIRELMEARKLYTQPGLTISDLAEVLAVQEYRLRRLINQTMGHRNFNQFLNSYRIEDASHRLLESEAPISTIALDVGYSSLSVFNKAFKERFGMTPSAYRQREQGA